MSGLGLAPFVAIAAIQRSESVKRRKDGIAEKKKRYGLR